jgi:hypothetical integral membrane protein (TIGR02206 family)
MGDPTFELFGTAHVTGLVLILAAALAITQVPPAHKRRRLATAIACALLALALLKPFAFVGIYGQPWQTSLPLDLCRINEFLCVYMLLARSRRAFDVAYFLAVAGSVAALLTPDLRHGFPDPRFVLFFVSHGLAILAVLYAISGYGFRPTLRSVGITLAFLGVYTLIMAAVNVMLDANYLFLREKPEGASVMDLMGPWPYYLIWLIGAAIVLCWLCYLPFAVMARRAAGRD